MGWGYEASKPQGGLPPLGRSIKSPDYIDESSKLSTVWFCVLDVAAAAAKSLQSCPTLRPHRRQPTRLPRPWGSPGKNTGVGCHFLLQCRKVKSESEVAQLCPTFSNPMDCSLPGSSIHGIFQARVLEWGAIAFSIICHQEIQIKATRMASLTQWT